jgi:hypothetical protein
MDGVNIKGIIRIRELPDPDWTPEQYAYWWLDEFDADGRRVRIAKMTQREKDRYTVYEASNLVMTAGITQILTFIGNSASNTAAFSQYIAIGTGSIFTVNANDSTLATEFFRKAVTGYSTSGNQVDVSTNLLTTDAVGTWTNMGLYGVAATGTANSGTLMTHVLVAYTKPSATRTADYLITAQ